MMPQSRNPTIAGRLAKRFSDWRIRALFSFQDLYVGLSPYTAPGVFSLLAATELTDGVWYPIGGFGKVRRSDTRGSSVIKSIS